MSSICIGSRAGSQRRVRHQWREVSGFPIDRLHGGGYAPLHDALDPRPPIGTEGAELRAWRLKVPTEAAALGVTAASPRELVLERGTPARIESFHGACATSCSTRGASTRGLKPALF
jgi:hypothetical protein